MNKKDEIFTGFTLDDIFKDSLNLKIEGEEKLTEEEVSEDSKQKLVKVHNEGIEILDDELLNKISNKNLSASMVSSFLECPADWLMNSFILPLVDHKEPIYFVRGKLFHDTMEEFFKLDKEHRNPSTLSKTAMTTLQTKYKDLMEDKETIEWMKRALKGYLEYGFEYKTVDVARIKKNEWSEPSIGTELFVRGKLGNTKREVVGLIDRLDSLPDGTFRIVDYKTGGKIAPFNPDVDINDNNSFSYWRQQLAYSMLLEADGYSVSEAFLEFPIAKGVVEVDLNNEKLRKQVEADFERLDSMLSKCVEDRFFPFAGHFFCKWCGMLSPNYTVSRYGKLNISWEDLSQYVKTL